MKRTKSITAAALAAAVLSVMGAFASRPDNASCVNPFIGCAFNGHAFVAAAYPFGMIQAGPDTGNESWAYGFGYRYTDTVIQGFSQTHLSGTGCADLGDLRVQPFTGPIVRDDYGERPFRET